MAAIVRSDTSDKILLFDGNKGYERTLVPDLGAAGFHLGNLVWAQDSATFYVSAFVKTNHEDVSDYSLAEIPLDGTPGRLTRIASVHEPKGVEIDGLLALSMHVSLSPEGQMIAATPAVLDKHVIADRDRALFLINVRDPSRHLLRIPIPDSPAESFHQRFEMIFLRLLFAHFCGQQHCWVLSGQILPFCQRCTGLYVGGLIALLLMFVFRLQPTRF